MTPNDPADTAEYLGPEANEFGVIVASFRCQTCGDVFTICPHPEPDHYHEWSDCMADECPSYDPDRDATRFFDAGDVRSLPIEQLIEPRIEVAPDDPQ